MTGPVDTLRWAAEGVGVPDGERASMAQLLAGDADSFGFVVHHDGSGRVDLSVVCDRGSGRTVEVPGLGSIMVGEVDVADYRVDGSEAQLAGVFHPVVEADVPGWPRPLLIAELIGRAGQHRMIFPVIDDAAFTAAAQRIALPEVVRRFLTGPTVLRLGLDHLGDGFGERLGFEIVMDPAVFEVGHVLAALGVEDSAISSLQALAATGPRSRRLPRSDLPAWQEDLAYSHFSITWPTCDARPVLTSHLMVRCGPEPDRAQLRDTAVRVHGIDWPAHVRWAARQLPLRRPAVGRRLDPWRSAVDPHRRGAFEHRLAHDALSTDTACAALLLPAPSEDPDWWPTYQGLVTAVANRVESPGQAWTVPFGPLLWSIVAAEAGDLLVDLQWDLLQRLSRIAAPALNEMRWQERPFGARIAAQIAAEDEEHGCSEFEEFCTRHACDGLTEVLLKYPVLGMVLAREIDHWRASTAQMLARIDTDRAALSAVFGIPIDAGLDEVSLTAGDPHNEGRTVRVLRFGDMLVVYKPRSVRLEGLYADTAQSLRRHGFDLRAPAVLDRGDYGYVAFVTHEPAQDHRAFYRNAGGLLALLHVLGATDCHQENLIACGEHLILIDAETLVTGPATPASEMSAPQVGDDISDDLNSVLRVGMLPAWLWLDGRRKAVDITALGVDPGGRTQKVTGWRALNTDAMVRGQVSRAVGHPQCLPTASGVPAPVAEHIDDLVDGFTQVYRILAAGRNTWVRDCLQGVESANNRAVLRPTYVYASLLADLLEPAALRSAHSRAWVLEKLTRAYLNDPEGLQWPLLAAEQQALNRGDVPFFQRSLRTGTTVWSGGAIAGYPGGGQLSAVLARLDNLGDDDLEVQTALIRSTVTASRYRMSEQVGADTSSDQPRPAAAVARDCFDRACASPIVWLGPTVLPDGERVTIRAIGSGLYDGRLGFAVACACADRPVAAEVLAPVLRIAQDPHLLSRYVQVDGLGLAGVGGLLRGLDVLGRADVIDDALREVLTPQSVARDTRRDLLLGVAGLIGPLTARSGFGDVLAAAAATLVAAQDAATGAWATLPGSAHLTGMAHGAAGIAMALVQAGISLGDEELIDTAVRGLEYEARVFDADNGNWPDFREGAGQAFMLGWCAGAPGIALSRHVLLSLLPDHAYADRWFEDMQIALDTTARTCALARDHLCCGNASRIAVLRALGRSEQADSVVDVVTSRSAGPVPMLALDQRALPMKGLFTGLPGIGLTLAGDTDWVLRLLV